MQRKYFCKHFLFLSCCWSSRFKHSFGWGIHVIGFFLIDLLDKGRATGSETAVEQRLKAVAEQWELLTQKTSEKTFKLKEANKQRSFNAAVKDLDFWLGEVNQPQPCFLSVDDKIKHLLILFQIVGPPVD